MQSPPSAADTRRAASSLITGAAGSAGDAEAATTASRAATTKAVFDAVKVHPNSAEARRFPYGAVANAFREALLSSTAKIFGLSRDDLIAQAGRILGQDISKMNHIDTLKRLKKSGDMVVVNGRHKPGPNLLGKMKSDAAKEGAE